MVHARQLEAEPRIRNPRSARTATQTRIVHNGRARYANIVRVSAVLGVVLAMLMGYVMLTSNVTSMTYTLANAREQRDALQEQTARLDDRLADLRSVERLARIARQLHMHEPQQFALVTLGAPPVVAQSTAHLTMLSSLAGWLHRNPHVQER